MVSDHSFLLYSLFTMKKREQCNQMLYLFVIVCLGVGVVLLYYDKDYTLMQVQPSIQETLWMDTERKLSIFCGKSSLLSRCDLMCLHSNICFIDFLLHSRSNYFFTRCHKAI